MKTCMADENAVHLAKESDFSFIRIHPLVFIINEIQKCNTVQHSTLMLNNNVLYVLVHNKHLYYKRVREKNIFATFKFFVSEISLIYAYLLKYVANVLIF
jgi:hypothetical protein